MKRKPYPSKPSRGSKTASPSAAPMLKFTVEAPSELLEFLLIHIKSKGRNAIKSMLSHEQIHVDGRAVTAYNEPLQPGQIVTVHKERPAESFPFAGLSILHEDEHLIVIQKDAGLLSIASDKESELTAYRQLTAHVRLTDPKVRIFVVHRLDRDTSGVMMYAKRQEVQQTLQQNWNESVLERTYIALVEGKVKKEEGMISSWLKETKTLKMYSSPHPGDGQHAVTHYKVIKTGQGYSLLQVRLETGRKNQIRVHMEDIGHPIVGDKKYGSKSRAIGRLGLHASVLAFTHPVTGQVMRFESKIPKAFTNLVQA